MAYTEQLKRGNKPSQGLSETGCWKREGQALVLQTLQSNGMPIDTNDPIYTNRYAVSSLAGSSLAMRHADGSAIKARRMSPGYRQIGRASCRGRVCPYVEIPGGAVSF